MHGWKRSLAFTLVFGGLLLFGGCGPGNPVATGVDRDTRIRLNILANLYIDYLSFHRGTPPKDMEAFREFLESRSDELKMYKESGVVGSVDDLLTSARDSKPFIVIFGKPMKVSQSPDAFWVAYEQQGVDGNRLAVSTYGGEQLLSPDEFSSEFSKAH
jgi:hypothetical protein